jgi:hypothetical protein
MMKLGISCCLFDLGRPDMTSIMRSDSIRKADLSLLFSREATCRLFWGIYVY